MKRLIVLGVILGVFFLIGSVNAAEKHVYPGASIQKAIDSSSPYDVVVVHGNGYTYQENVAINKQSITVKASGKVTVKPANEADDVFSIKPEGSYSTVAGFIITGSDYCGIRISTGAKGCKVSKNTVTGNDDGIYVNGASSITVSDNNVLNNRGSGIFFYCSDGKNSITRNAAINNGDGGLIISACPNSWISDNLVKYNRGGGLIIGSSSPGNTLKMNLIAGNKDGNFKVEDGGNLSDYSQNINTSNTINGKPLYYLIGKRNLTYSNLKAGYMALISCYNLTLRSITVNGNDKGILLINTRNSRIENSNLTNNTNGISLHNNSSYNQITGNILKGNQNGLWLSYSSKNNKILYNNISYNKAGVSVDSPNNTLKNNKISNNSNAGVDLYDGGNYIVGNTITSNGHGISLSGGSNNNLSQNNISGNKSYGVEIYQSPGSLLVNNQISYNRKNGINILYSTNRVNYNSIVGNIGYGLMAANKTKSIVIDARYNYWGSNSNPVQKISNPQLVSYKPWLIL